MKLFHKRILYFVLPIIILAVFADVLLRNIPNDYGYKSKYLDTNSRKIEVLFLGSSHTYFGINPKYMKLKSFNASHVSQSLNIDYQILKKYEKKWDNLKYIVVPIDYVSLYERLENTTEAWRLKNYTIYYNINVDSNIIYNSEILNNKFKINSFRLIRYYIDNESGMTTSSLGWGTNYHSNKSLDLETTGKATAQNHRAVNNNFFKDNIKELKNIIEFANQRKIKILFITSPAYKSYTRNLNKNQLDSTTMVSKKLSNSYTKSKYINFLDDNSFTENDFYDGNHLNEIGAKKLTLKIDSIINSAKI